MPITRREFLQRSGTAGMALALHSQGSRPAPKFRTEFNLGSLAPFVDPLPIPPLAKSTEMRPSPTDPAAKLPYYRVPMREFNSKLHRDLKLTRQWGYAGGSPGPTFEAKSGQGILVEWANELPASHFLPIDHTLHGAESDKPEVRTVVHLHGAKAPPDSDGYPENWFVPGKSAVYHYPNHQEACTLWYHDHALGINRLNVFAGLMGMFLVRDEFEASLGLPSGKYEVPLVICDRALDLEHQLNYPVSADPKKPWTPEVFCEGILLNGKLFPYLEVEPRKYRLRVLNGSNARFFHLSLPGAQMWQIGSDQGLLPAPVTLSIASLAPGERADLVVDFSTAGGSNLAFKNDISAIMQFRVAKGARDTTALPQSLRPVPRIAESSATKTRMLSLVEVDDLVQRPVIMLLNNAHWSMPVTERPALDSTEIWGLANTTDDSHPIHLHLVRFQILDRRRFDINTYWGNNGEIRYKGPAIPPEAAEAGWKDTVRADPGMVTRIIARFEGYPGRYVWHCHILEHEDNEMMRPFDVVAGK